MFMSGRPPTRNEAQCCRDRGRDWILGKHITRRFPSWLSQEHGSLPLSPVALIFLLRKANVIVAGFWVKDSTEIGLFFLRA